jgi:hypothetical protein
MYVSTHWVGSRGAAGPRAKAKIIRRECGLPGQRISLKLEKEGKARRQWREDDQDKASEGDIEVAEFQSRTDMKEIVYLQLQDSDDPVNTTFRCIGHSIQAQLR